MLSQIRTSQMDDLPRLMQIYARARQLMKDSGNPEQWAGSYPAKEDVLADIEAGKSFVCLNEKDEIAAVFFFDLQGGEPTYRQIYEGAWLNDAPYGVIHRVASAGTERGVMPFLMEWCFRQTENVRIDTHRDNRPMRSSLEKMNFSYCGIIYLANGDERLAYQKEREQIL